MTNIKELLTQKENRKLEFKRELPSNDKLIKTAIAFSNSQGGDLIIGVVHFFPSSQKPHYIKAEGKHKGTYIRVGSTNRLATLDILENLEREKRSISYDSVVLYDCEYKEGILSQIDRHIERKLNEKADIFTYEKLKLVKKERDKYYLTNLGIWFSSLRTDYFPLLKIECARFKGTSTKVFLDQATFDGDMIEAIEKSINFIKKNIRLGATIGEVYREDRWEYPLLALREMVINAVVHRDYSVLGSDIKIAIFDDMIEITSPGVLLIDKDKLGLGYSELRNQNLGNLFKTFKIIEQWGTGYEKIQKELQNYPEIDMEIDDTSSFVQVRLVKVSTTSITTPITTRQKLLVLIRNNPKITRDELAKELDISINTVKEYIQKLKKEKILKRIGDNRNGYWSINETN